MVNKQQMGNIGTMFLCGIGGAMLTSAIVNNTPWLKELSPTKRSLVQLGAGGATLLFTPEKYRVLRYAAMGTAWAGGLGTVERATGMKTLAGDAEGTLSAAEIRALQAMGALPMNGPATFSQQMAGPATFTNPMGGRPSMMGGFKAPT